MKAIRNLTMLATILIAASTHLAMAQKPFAPMNTWPYLYEDFVSGTVVTLRGDSTAYKQMNICIADGKLHFVRGDVILAAEMSNISEVTIGSVKFVNSRRQMMRLVEKTPHGAVLLFTGVDKKETEKVEVGYGESSLAATQRITTVALEGGNIPPVMTLNKRMSELGNKFGGENIPVKKTVYLNVDGFVVPAIKQDLMNMPGIDKSALRSWFKQNKFAPENPGQMATLVEWLYEMTSR